MLVFESEAECECTAQCVIPLDTKAVYFPFVSMVTDYMILARVLAYFIEYL